MPKTGWLANKNLSTRSTFLLSYDVAAILVAMAATLVGMELMELILVVAMAASVAAVAVVVERFRLPVISFQMISTC